MELKDLLSLIWASAYTLALGIALGVLLRPRLGEIFRKDFALGVWSLAMVLVSVFWMISYGAATFWELNTLSRTFDEIKKPELDISHIVLPLLLSFGFAFLVTHSWKVYIALPVAILLGFVDLGGMSVILNGITEIIINYAKSGKYFSESARIFQEYFLDRPHLLRIVSYMIVLSIGVFFAVLSVGKGLCRIAEPKDKRERVQQEIAQKLELHHFLFDRLARISFMVAIIGNETVIWSWRLARTAQLKAAGFHWWQ